MADARQAALEALLAKMKGQKAPVRSPAPGQNATAQNTTPPRVIQSPTVQTTIVTQPQAPPARMSPPTPSAPLTGDPEARLKTLLDRIGARKR